MAKLGPSILHSVSYAGLWGQAFLPLEQFIDKAADLGYEGVMLMGKRPHLSILDADAQTRQRLRKKIEDRKLSTVCIAGYNNFTADLEHGDVPHREFQIQHIVELAKLARDLGSDLVRVFTGYESSAAPLSAQWKIVVDSLRECAKRSSEFGVTIGVQNHHDLAAGYELMYDLVQAVNEPNCRALFDAWAPFLHNANLTDAARKLAPVSVHTTIADYELRPRYHYNAAVVNYTPATPLVQAVPMGTGVIDYDSFLRTMEVNGFTGSIAYEMCSPLLHGGDLETLDRYARTFLEYMDRLRSSIDSHRTQMTV
jgi:sugar phosphate isomerase/epimerase